MATHFRCVQGHLWEDAFGGPTLIEGEVRCPQCGYPSYACKPSRDVEAPTESYPLPPSSSEEATAALPQPAHVPVTVIRSALANSPAKDADESLPPPSRSRKMSRSRAAETGPKPADGTPRPLPNIPGYEILSELGRGGMGVVYKARQTGLNRLVAIKMIIAGGAADDRERARFRTEAEAIARLHHPNIVQIYDVNEYEGSPWFSLEFVDGGSLSDRLKGDPLPVNDSASLIAILADAIHYAHEHGVVHRDLKPGNVLLQSAPVSSTTDTPRLRERKRDDKSDSSVATSGAIGNYWYHRAKITDFGLAKTLDQDIHHTRSGMVVGTPSYMAPEQATSGSNVGPPSDIYALGVILYQIVTGRLPFVGDTPMEIMIKLTQEEPPPPTRYLPKLPRDLQTIILKCLEKNPHKRYLTARELADDLRRFLSHEPILARPVGRLERGIRWMRRRPTISALMLLVWFSMMGLGITLGVLARNEQIRKSRLRQEVERELTQAQMLYDANDWDSLPARLAQQAERLTNEPSLAPLLERIENLGAKTSQKLRAKRTFQAFNEARTAAVFRATQESEATSPDELMRTREAIEGALQLVGASAEHLPDLDDAYAPEEKEVVREGCYELMLLLAESVARDPSQIDQALAILDRAAMLAPDTPAIHLRRARFLREAGRIEEENRERRLAAEVKPTSYLDYYLLGQERLRENQLGEAEAAFDASLRLKPSNFWATYFLALCHVYQGKMTAARDNLTACLANKPGEVRILLLRAFVQGQLGRHREAEADFSAALERLGDRADRASLYALYNNRAVTRLGQDNKLQQAEDDLRKAIELYPEGFHAYVTLAEIHEKQKQVKEALAAMDRAIENATLLSRNNKLDKLTLAQLHQSRYRLRVKLSADQPGADQLALQDLNKVLELGKNGTSPSARARTFRDRGHVYLRAGDLARALDDYNNAAKEEPKNPEYQRWRGEVLIRRKEYEKALAAFDRYVELRGKPELSVLRGRALSLTFLKQYDRAAVAFTQAIERSPRDARLFELRGRAYLACNAWELALKDFDVSLNLQPSSAAHEGRALALLRLNKPLEAARDAEALGRASPKDHDKLYVASQLLAQAAGQLDSNRPGDPRRRDRQRLQKEAIDYLEQAFQALPQDQRAAFWRKVDAQPSLRPLREHPDYVRLERRHASWRNRS